MKIKGLLLLFILIACDYTSSIHKEILDVQDLIQDKAYKPAAEKYLKILKKKPSQELKLKINFLLGDLYSLNLSEPQNGIKHFAWILKNTNDPLWLVRAQEKIGEINFSMLNNFYESAKNYYSLTQITPKLEQHNFYEYRLAISYLQSSQNDPAKKVLERMIGEPSNKYHVRSYYYYGMVFFQKKQWDDAIKYWKEYLKREKRNDFIVQTKFLMANVYETREELKKAYNLYYSLLGEYPNPDVIKHRLESIYERRVSRKR